MRSSRWASIAVSLSLLTLAHERDAAGNHASEPIAVIVHPDNPLSRVSSSELRAMLLRRKGRWPDGSPIRMLNWEANSPTRVALDQAVLRMSPERAAAYWVDQRIRGLGTPPRSINSAQLILAIIARNRDFISYVPARDATPRVKILIVDGKKPGDALYPIQRPSE